MLQFMGDHPILTVVLVAMALQTVVYVVEAVARIFHRDDQEEEE